MGKKDKILVEDAEVLEHTAYPGDQYVLRLNTNRIAVTARPGSFIHIRCDEDRPLRRPLSIMRASVAGGWIELLYRVVGDGTAQLSRVQTGQCVNLMGPIGIPFTINPEHELPLLIGGGVGVPPMVFLADTMHHARQGISPLVLMGSETPFPFRLRPSQIMVPGLPADVIAAMPLLEDWGIASRLASLQGYAGCFNGYVTDLAKGWLDSLDASSLRKVAIFACGPWPMLEATARLAHDYGLPCQISLEEYMACAVGGCAGCTVPIHTADGIAMKRVCVDGPVFDSRAVFPEGHCSLTPEIRHFCVKK